MCTFISIINNLLWANNNQTMRQHLFTLTFPHHISYERVFIRFIIFVQRPFTCLLLFDFVCQIVYFQWISSYLNLIPSFFFLSLLNSLFYWHSMPPIHSICLGHCIVRCNDMWTTFSPEVVLWYHKNHMKRYTMYQFFFCS